MSRIWGVHSSSPRSGSQTCAGLCSVARWVGSLGHPRHRTRQERKDLGGKKRTNREGSEEDFTGANRKSDHDAVSERRWRRGGGWKDWSKFGSVWLWHRSLDGIGGGGLGGVWGNELCVSLAPHARPKREVGAAHIHEKRHGHRYSSHSCMNEGEAAKLRRSQLTTPEQCLLLIENPGSGATVECLTGLIG
jgi:hypothetical protein